MNSENTEADTNYGQQQWQDDSSRRQYTQRYPYASRPQQIEKSTITSAAAAAAAAAAMNVAGPPVGINYPIINHNTSPQQEAREHQSALLPPLTESNLLVLEELRVRARRHVEDYIVHSIPIERKEAYLEAMSRAPHLVATESDPIQFVRYCNYNVWEAAERLLLYWKERKEAFGPDRAFLPLTLTGDGAMTHADILSLEAGYPCVLPDSRYGQQVLFGDRRQYVRAATFENRVRSAFYIINSLSSDDRAQTKGVLLFILLVMPRVQGFDRKFVKKSFSLAVNVFPVKFHVHLLNCLPKTATKRYAVQDIISSYVLEIMELGFRAENLEVHIEREEGEILQDLLALGLTREGIPTSVGGNWSYDKVAAWCKQRAKLEGRQNKYNMATRGLPPTAQSRLALPSTPVAAAAAVVRNPSQGSAAFAVHQSPQVVVDEDEKRSQLRTYNAIHSRRKRARQRKEFENLKDESKHLKTEHEQLIAENLRLNMLLNEAHNALQQNNVAPSENEERKY